MKTLIVLIAMLALVLAAACRVPCATCNGTGKVLSVGTISIDCPTCDGTGKVKRSDL